MPSIDEAAKLPKYGQIVRWTRFDGNSAVTEVFGDNLGEVRCKGWEFAARSGWTPIRWWKFWRWGDTPNPEGAALTAALAKLAETKG